MNPLEGLLEELENLRLEAKESQQALGRAIGKDGSSVSRYLSGETPLTWEMLGKILEHYGVTLSDLEERLTSRRGETLHLSQRMKRLEERMAELEAGRGKP